MWASEALEGLGMILQVAVPIPGVWAYDYLAVGAAAGSESAPGLVSREAGPQQASFLAAVEEPVAEQARGQGTRRTGAADSEPVAERVSEKITEEIPAVGAVVRVPVGPRQVVGVVIGHQSEASVDRRRLKGIFGGGWASVAAGRG